MNHCICDATHLLAGLVSVRDGTKPLDAAVGEYEAEMIPRGHEEVKCSVENGYMLHDWNLVEASPVFTRGFKPMEGHDGKGRDAEEVHVAAA